MKEQREKTLKILQSKLFVTPETRQAIYREAAERSKERVIEIERDLEEMLDQILKTTLTQKRLKGNIIIHTPERRIGKTRALIKTAAEWNIPIIAELQERNIMIQEIRSEYKDEVIPILTLREAEQALRASQYRAILKTEMVPTEKVEEMLRKIGEENLAVIGFEEV